MNVPLLGSVIGRLAVLGIDYGKALIVTALLILYFFFALTNQSFGFVLSFLFLTAPFWLTYLIFESAHYKWTFYIVKAVGLKEGRTTLEVKLPAEVTKSPQAMEVILNQMWNIAKPRKVGEAYLEGKRPPTYSLEIASRGGEVKFYINAPNKSKNMVEVQLYAQYPGIEVHEMPIDYTAEISNDSDEYDIFSVHLNKKQDDIFPIATYVDFGLDQMPKEEEKIDPLTVWLDNLGSINADERIWVQILIRGHKDYPFSHGGFTWKIDKKNTFQARIQTEIDKLTVPEPVATGDESPLPGSVVVPPLSTETKKRADALERKAGKLQFDTAIRFIYATKKGKFNGDRLVATINSFRAFDVVGRNEIGVWWLTDFYYKSICDPIKRRLPNYKRSELNDYKLRRYNCRNIGLVDAPKIFSAEELATMWHLPGQVALTPTLTRISSTRSEAPPNLPT